MKKVLSFLLAVVLVLTIAPFSASHAEAATYDETRSLITLKKEKSNIAPGVTQEIGTVRKKYNGQQLVYYTMKVDLNNQYANIHANYKDNDPEAAFKNFGMQKVVNQMDAAQEKHKDDPNYHIVGGINGTGYNMSTGETRGILVMEGQVVHEDMVNASSKPEGFLLSTKTKKPISIGILTAKIGKTIKIKLRMPLTFLALPLLKTARSSVVFQTPQTPVPLLV